jgi:hypothetical protein
VTQLSFVPISDSARVLRRIWPTPRRTPHRHDRRRLDPYAQRARVAVGELQPAPAPPFDQSELDMITQSAGASLSRKITRFASLRSGYTYRIGDTAPRAQRNRCASTTSISGSTTAVRCRRRDEQRSASDRARR